MAGRAETYDVWFIVADTVYKGVPISVVTNWAEQGRLAGTDRVRPSGVNAAWQKVSDHPLISDFLFSRDEIKKLELSNTPAEPVQPLEVDAPWHRKHEEEDDDVDMIPLIDISLVLLIFFMMTAAVSTLSPVDVPGMQYASELSADKDAITLIIDKRSTGEIYYALRVGDQPIATEDNNLPGPNELIARLDAKLSGSTRPPEVRIACHKELPRGRVREVAKELDKRKQRDQIASYGAEVNEQK